MDESAEKVAFEGVFRDCRVPVMFDVEEEEKEDEDVHDDENELSDSSELLVSSACDSFCELSLLELRSSEAKYIDNSSLESELSDDDDDDMSSSFSICSLSLSVAECS